MAENEGEAGVERSAPSMESVYPHVYHYPPAALSTWGEAIVAAATGDAERMRQLLAGVDDDGSGIDLRTFRTSYSDVEFIAGARNVLIDPNYTLVEIAVERDHFEVVMALTEAPTATTAPPVLARSVSSLSPDNFADHVRDDAAASLEAVGSGTLQGLVRLQMPAEERHTFLLPASVMALPLEARRTACGMLMEDPATQEGVDAAVSWWSATVGAARGLSLDAAALAFAPWGLYALYTSGDGNCLLHAAMLGSFGVRDTRIARIGEPGACDTLELERIAPRRSLRAALHHSLLHCTPLRARLAAYGAALDGGVGGGDGGVGGAPTAEPASGETLESRSRLHARSCDPAHVWILAHVLGRPIVCLASAAVGEVRVLDQSASGEPRTFSWHAAQGERMSGVYLPSLLPPDECCRDPLLIAYTRGHFSALVTAESAADVWGAFGIAPAAIRRAPAVPVPLTDETGAPLPVLFPPTDVAYGSEAERALLSAYLDVYDGVVPPPTASEGGSSQSPTVVVGTVVGSATPSGLPPADLAGGRSASIVDGAADVGGAVVGPPPTAILATPSQVLLAAQHTPARAGRGAADQFYEGVWARREAAAKMERGPSASALIHEGSRPESASRENSSAALEAAIAASLRDAPPRTTQVWS